MCPFKCSDVFRIAGGGAGGSIWIECEEIIGHGWMYANGGNGRGTSKQAGGGGAGGRISIETTNAHKLNITLEAHGGECVKLIYHAQIQRGGQGVRTLPLKNTNQ